jgi:hypothetical protein
MINNWRKNKRIQYNNYNYSRVVSIEKEYLCLAASFDHNIVDGTPAARFIKQFTATIKSGHLLLLEKDCLK